MSRAAAGEATGMWPGGSLRDPPQSQYIKANVANPHGLVQIKLYNRNLLGRAFMAKKASAVAAVEAKQGGVRGPPAAAAAPPAPHTLQRRRGRLVKDQEPLGTARSRAGPHRPSPLAPGAAKPLPSCAHRPRRRRQCRALAGPWLLAEKGRSRDRRATAPLEGYLGALPVMLASRDSKLGSTFVTGGPIAPWRLLGQHVCKDGQRGPVPIRVTVPGDLGAVAVTWAQEQHRGGLWSPSTCQAGWGRRGSAQRRDSTASAGGPGRPGVAKAGGAVGERLQAGKTGRGHTARGQWGRDGPRASTTGDEGPGGGKSS